MSRTGQAPPPLVLPRFGTPRDPSQPTYGHEVAEIAVKLRLPLMPWQRHAVDVALEFDPKTGELVYEEVDLTVPRQSGKSTLVFALLVWRCTTAARRWGSQNATYLAQTRSAARKKLEREFSKRLRQARPWFTQVTNPRARPTKPTHWKLSLNNGAENIMFGTESYLQIEAPSETASHGDTLDMPVIDEAFSHRDNAVEDAVEPAMMTRSSPQLWVISTAGNERSVYLYRKVLAGRRACELGKHGKVCYLEWSAPDDIDFDDPDAFASYHPAVGHTITEQRLRAKLDKARRNPDAIEEDGDDPGEDGFRRAYGNQWMRFPTLHEAARPLVVPTDKWESLVDSGSQISGRLAFGVSVAPGGASASIAVVGYRDDGLPHVEVVERQDGVWWFERRLTDCVARWSPAAVAFDNFGPTKVVAPEISRAAGAASVVKLGAAEYAAACDAFLVAVTEDRVRHLGQTWLTTAIGGAAKRVRGDGFMWDFGAATADITPLVAVTVALRALEQLPAPPPPAKKARVYSF